MMSWRGLLLISSAVWILTATFFAGRSYGTRKMDTFCGILLQASNAGQHVDTLKHHLSATEALQDGDMSTVEKELRFLAYVDAQIIVECDHDAQCARFMGNAPPSDEVLRKALARR